MKAQRKGFGFREDAITWIKDRGFYYVDSFGWCHADGFAAIVEYTGREPGRPWALTIYKSAIPNKPVRIAS